MKYYPVGFRQIFLCQIHFCQDKYSALALRVHLSNQIFPKRILKIIERNNFIHVR